MAKPNKSILKRIKITKTGKLIRRRAGQNHFNAKESGRSQRRKRIATSFPPSVRREILARI
ncbi:MAG: 50S ribosomal protein L35 [Patescibacteria group bacterium]